MIEASIGYLADCFHSWRFLKSGLLLHTNKLKWLMQSPKIQSELPEDYGYTRDEDVEDDPQEDISDE